MEIFCIKKSKKLNYRIVEKFDNGYKYYVIYDYKMENVINKVDTINKALLFENDLLLDYCKSL